MTRPASYDLPGNRTEFLAEPDSTAQHARDGYLCADSPTCRWTHWGHRLTLADAPRDTDDLVRWFRTWLDEHGGKGIEAAYLTHEVVGAGSWSGGEPLPGVTVSLHANRRGTGLPPVVRTPPVTLRPLRGDADWDRLFALGRAVHGEDGAGARAYATWSTNERRAKVEQGRGLQLGAFAGEELVGMAALVWDAEVVRYREVAVHADHRRQGVAEALVRWLAEFAARELPGRPLWINADIGGPAEGIYERLGFVAETTTRCWQMRGLLTEAEIEARWARLGAATLDLAQWRHRDHLWGAVRVLDEHGGDVDAATATLRGILQRLLAAHGVETTPTAGYHETLTRGWLELAGALRRDEPFLDAVLRAQMVLGDKRRLLRYWSREALMSPEARHGWLPPDRAPLDGPGLEPEASGA